MSLWNSRDWRPMLLKEIDSPFDSNDYIYEIKFDGIRACIFIGPNHFEIRSRNNRDITYLYPELKNIQKLVTKNTILDGEIIIMSKTGPSFLELQKRNNLKNLDSIRQASIENPVIFVAFDILYESKDLINLKLLERKKYLEKIPNTEYLIKPKFYLSEGKKLFNTIKKLHLEGIVAKEINSTYTTNYRSDKWLKIKNIKEEDFYIGGYILKNTGYISIILGTIKNNKLYYVGSASLTINKELSKKIFTQKKEKISNFIDYQDKNAIYIKPGLKCTIRYLEKTKNGHLRHPIIMKG